MFNIYVHILFGAYTEVPPAQRESSHTRAPLNIPTGDHV